MSFTTLIIEEIQRECITIHLNRPQVRNALNPEMIKELTEAVKQCQDNPAVKVIVFMGQGGFFCAGADVNWMKSVATYTYDQNKQDAQHLAYLFETIHACPKPTIAAVQGGAFGGGLGLVAVCDIAIAHEETIFSLSEVRLGLVPGVISPYLIKAIGTRQAQRLTLTGERFQAHEALHLGLIHHVVSSINPLEEMVTIVQCYVDQVLKGSPQAQAAAKQLFKDLEHANTLTDRRRITTKAIAEARVSLDGKEGLQAFLEKRPPAWIMEHS